MGVSPNVKGGWQVAGGPGRGGMAAGRGREDERKEREGNEKRYKEDDKKTGQGVDEDGQGYEGRVEEMRGQFPSKKKTA